MKIFHKLLFAFLGVSLLAVFSVSLFFYADARKALLSRAFDQLTSVKTLKKTKLEDLRIRLSERLTQYRVRRGYRNTPLQVEDLPDYTGGVLSLFYLTEDNRIFFPNEPDSLIAKAIRDIREGFYPHLDRVSDSIAVMSDLGFVPMLRIPLFCLAVKDCVTIERGKGRDRQYDTYQGYWVLAASFKLIDDILTERSGLGESGESYLVGADGRMRSNSRFSSEPTVLKARALTTATVAARNGQTTPLITEDYRGVRVLSAFSDFDQECFPDWVILSEIDYDEVVAPLQESATRFVLVIFFVSIIVCVVSYLIAGHFSKAIDQIRVFLERVSNGELPSVPRLRFHEGDELGAMTHSVTRLQASLAATRRFASEIGRGNFDAEFHPLGNNDETGYALLSMRGELKRLVEIAERQRMLRTAALLEGEESERNRISRELHDGLGQILTAIQFQMQGIPPSATRDELSYLIKDAVDEVRSLSYNLMPRVLMDFGLNAALEKLTNEASKVSPPTTVSLHSTLPASIRFSQSVEIGLFRIVQEALTNALKHANAARITLSVNYDAPLLLVMIDDNGAGFDLSAPPRQGNGLRNMEERAKLIGGHFAVQSSTANGTQVRIELHPLPRQ